MQYQRDTTQMIHAALRLAGQTRTTQRELALRHHVLPCTVTRLLKGQRPTPENLRGLTHHWLRTADGIEVLCAHLRDEVARARVPEDEVDIAPANAPADGDLDVRQAITELRRLARTSEQTRNLLLDLAIVLRAADHAAARGLQVAADAPADGEQYQTNPRNRGQKKRS